MNERGRDERRPLPSSSPSPSTCFVFRDPPRQVCPSKAHALNKSSPIQKRAAHERGQEMRKGYSSDLVRERALKDLDFFCFLFWEPRRKVFLAWLPRKDVKLKEEAFWDWQSVKRSVIRALKERGKHDASQAATRQGFDWRKAGKGGEGRERVHHREGDRLRRKRSGKG